MKKTLFFLGFIAFSLVSSAQSADEIWKQLLGNHDYRVSEVGVIGSYYLYDVDGDGINECFMKADDDSAYAIYCCGDANGKPSIDAVTEIYTCNAPLMVSIVKGTPFVSQFGSCGTGCYSSSFCKIEKSRAAKCYTEFMVVGIGEDEPTAEYSMGDFGEEPHPISKVLFNKRTPQDPQHIVIDEELKWIKTPVSSVKTKTTAVPSQGNAASFFSQNGDTIIVKDGNGYLYQLTGTDRAGVAPGGAYSGDIVIPSTITYNGMDYTVTTVRRGAMWKKPGASNIGSITSITLPETVTLVGTDAFRDNESLREVNYGKNTRIEVRSFFGCPNLKLDTHPSVYAYTEPFDAEGDGNRYVFSRMYVPTEQPMEDITGYQWAIFKHHHNAVYFDGWQNMQNEEAMGCYCSDLSYVRSGRFILKDNTNADAMFKGYRQSDQLVLIAHNNYVARHEFPIYSRWIWGEEPKSMPASFIASVAKKYGRKVKYSYEAARLLYTDVPEQFVITEFEHKNGYPMVVFSWVRNGMEVCWHVMKGEMPVEDPNSSVWNVDDDGTYGIPMVISITKDERGNVEVIMNHPAPESINLMHLVQDGTKLTIEGEDQWYVRYR